MKQVHARSKHHAQLAHHIPGRLRVRLPRGDRRSHVMERLQHDLLTQPGVHAVDVNHAAGSVTVSYDPQQHSDTSMLGLLEDLEVVVGTVLEVPHGATTLSLAGALDDLSHRFSAWTGHALNLRVLFPLSLAGFGLWQIRKHGLLLDTLPSWFLLWLAFDAFVKLHEHQGTPQ